MTLHTWLIYLHRISPWLRKVWQRANQACGGVFVAIGVALPLRAGGGAALPRTVKWLKSPNRPK